MEEIDLGAILAHGQVVRHQWPISNLTTSSIRILGAMAQTPCCSGFEDIPELIPSGETVRLPVYFKPDHQSGRKRLGFTVETDDRRQPFHQFVLKSKIYPEWEVVPAAGIVRSVPVGKGASQEFRLICRHAGRDSLGLPDDVKGSRLPASTFVGQTMVRTLEDQIQEEECRFAIQLPDDRGVGEHQEEVIFSWKEGKQKTYVTSWAVTPSVRVIPPGFVLRGEEGPVDRTILVSADDVPVRIQSITGPLSADPTPLSPEARPTQSVTIRIDPKMCSAGRATDIRIVTDHPKQPVVTVSVLILP